VGVGVRRLDMVRANGRVEVPEGRLDGVRVGLRD